MANGETDRVTTPKNGNGAKTIGGLDLKQITATGVIAAVLYIVAQYGLNPMTSRMDAMQKSLDETKNAVNELSTTQAFRAGQADGYKSKIEAMEKDMMRFDTELREIRSKAK